MTLQTQVKTPARAKRSRTRSALSQRKQEVTRDVITGAVADAIREVGVDFSVQDVADRAGVTHRTVYRHFEDRDALIDAVADRFERWLATEGVPQPRALDELSQHIEAAFRMFDRFPDLVSAAALLALTRGRRTAGSNRRTAKWRRIFEEGLPHLPPDELQPAFAVWRTMSSSIGWYLLSSQFGLSGARSGPAVRRALEVMIADLRRRNEDAAAGK